MTSRLLAACAIACCASPAAALTIRPDRDEAEYLELATHYVSSAALNAPDGEGVLIAPRWLLTTATRAKALRDRKPAPKLSLGGRAHDIEAFFLHPGWKDDRNDVGLLLLKEPVRGIQPTRLYRASDEKSRGVAVVGHGNGRKRAAINTIDRVEGATLALRIKPLDDASDLQGALTPAETGSAAYIVIDDERFVAGTLVSAGAEWQVYARASAFVEWIEATMVEVAKKEAEALLGERTH